MARVAQIILSTKTCVLNTNLMDFFIISERDFIEHMEINNHDNGMGE